jgi:secreted trypsin-like serine protease
VTNYSRNGNQPPSNDIAIFRLDGCSYKTPAQWNTNLSKDLIENQLIHIIGWGVKGWRGGGTTLKLEEIDMRVDQSCAAWAQYNMYEENKDAICATSYEDVQEPCMGDSGGPAFLKGSSQEVDLVIGVVSWGFDSIGMYAILVVVVVVVVVCDCNDLDVLLLFRGCFAFSG